MYVNVSERTDAFSLAYKNNMPFSALRDMIEKIKYFWLRSNNSNEIK